MESKMKIDKSCENERERAQRSGVPRHPWAVSAYGLLALTCWLSPADVAAQVPPAPTGTAKPAPVPPGPAPPAANDEVAKALKDAEDAKKRAVAAEKAAAVAHEKVAAAEKRAGDSQKEVDAAKKEANDAKENAEEADLAHDAYRFIQYGVTIGFGYIVHTGTDWTGDVLAEPQGSALGYLAILPGYWFSDAPRRAYCAAEWSTSEASATAAANQAPGTEGTTKKAPADPVEKGASGSTTNGSEGGQAVRRVWANWVYEACPFHKLGFYLGIPASFDGTVRLSERVDVAEAERTVSPVLSFGGIIAPNALVSTLVGFTVSTAKRDDGTDATIWTWNLGVGGNADLLSLLR